METRNQSVFGHIKNDLADIKTMLKKINAKLEKHVPSAGPTTSVNGSITSNMQSAASVFGYGAASRSQCFNGDVYSRGNAQMYGSVIGAVQIPGSISISDVANQSINVPNHVSGIFSYQMASAVPTASGSLPDIGFTNTFSNAPSPESCSFQIPALSCLQQRPGSDYLQHLATHNGNSSNPIPLIEYNLLKFDGGEDVRSWIGKCERVFILENTPQNCKVQRATMALEGSAFIWHRVYTYQKSGISWQEYSQAILKRFDKRKYTTKVFSCEDSSVPLLSSSAEGFTISSSINFCDEHRNVGQTDTSMPSPGDNCSVTETKVEVGMGFSTFLAPIHENRCSMEDFLQEEEVAIPNLPSYSPGISSIELQLLKEGVIKYNTMSDIHEHFYIEEGQHSTFASPLKETTLTNSGSTSNVRYAEKSLVTYDFSLILEEAAKLSKDQVVPALHLKLLNKNQNQKVVSQTSFHNLLLLSNASGTYLEGRNTMYPFLNASSDIILANICHHYGLLTKLCTPNLEDGCIFEPDLLQRQDTQKKQSGILCLYSSPYSWFFSCSSLTGGNLAGETFTFMYPY